MCKNNNVSKELHMPKKCEDHTLADQRRNQKEIDENFFEAKRERLAGTRAKGGRNSKRARMHVRERWSGAGEAAHVERVRGQQW